MYCKYMKSGYTRRLESIVAAKVRYIFAYVMLIDIIFLRRCCNKSQLRFPTRVEKSKTIKWN